MTRESSLPYIEIKISSTNIAENLENHAQKYKTGSLLNTIHLGTQMDLKLGPLPISKKKKNTER